MENPDIVYADPNECVKANPAAGPCSCPACMAEAKKVDENYIPKGIVLTDNHLSSPEPINRIAYEFTCTRCGETKNPDYAKCCTGCGVMHIKRSHKVMEFIRNHIAQNTPAKKA